MINRFFFYVLALLSFALALEFFAFFDLTTGGGGAFAGRGWQSLVAVPWSRARAPAWSRRALSRPRRSTLRSSVRIDASSGRSRARSLPWLSVRDDGSLVLYLRVRGGDSLHFFHFVFHELLPVFAIVSEASSSLSLSSSSSSSPAAAAADDDDARPVFPRAIQVVLLDRHLRDSASPPRNPWRGLFFPLLPASLNVTVVGAPPQGLSLSSFRTLPSFDRPLRWSPLLSSGAAFLRCSVCGFCRENELGALGVERKTSGSPSGLVVQLRVPPPPSMRSFMAEYREHVGRGAGGSRFFLYGSERRRVSNLAEVAHELGASTDVPESHPSLCSQISAYVNRSAMVFGHGVFWGERGRGGKRQTERERERE